MRLIDGDALKKAFYQKMKELLKSTDTPNISNEALSLLCGASLITEAPTIEPGRKNGRWINHRNDNGHNIADCSECGNAIQWFDDDEKPKFCCMCGADMREGKEG